MTETIDNSIKPRKVYTVYTTADDRIELRVCYATATAYTLTEGELTAEDNDVSCEDIQRMIDSLEDYDNRLV